MAEQARKPLTYYLSLLFKHDVIDIWVITLYSFCIGVLYLVIPITVQQLVNTFAFGTLVQPLLILALVIFLGVSAAGVINVLRILAIESIQQRMFARVALDLASRIPRLDMKVFREDFAPALINRFFEVTIIQKTLSKIMVDGIAIFLQSLIGLFILGAYHPTLLFLSVGLFVIVLFCIRLIAPSAIDTAISESTAKHNILAWLENLSAAPLTMKSIFGRVFGLGRTDELVRDYLEKRRSHFKALLGNHITFILSQVIASTGILALGGYLLVMEELTLGQLVAAELIVSALVANLSKFTFVIESFYDMVASASKIDSLLDLEEESEEGHELSISNKSGLKVELEGIYFFNYRNEEIFKDLSLTLPAGSRTVIYGANGSGKTLLANIILKFKLAHRGVVKIEDFAVTDLRALSLRNTIVLLEQEQVFQGTIEENLRLGHTELTLAEIRNSLEKVGLVAYIDELPDGLQTELNLSGWPLSRGQVKLLMFARAILQKPRMIIVDDALQGIDSEHIKDFILPFLSDPANPWTLLLLTLDMEQALKFDNPLMLKNGKLEPLV